jgi:hypothetical protein
MGGRMSQLEPWWGGRMSQLEPWCYAKVVIYAPSGARFSEKTWKKSAMRKVFKTIIPFGWTMRMNYTWRSVIMGCDILEAFPNLTRAKIEELELKLALISIPL